jgi:eukaryotic-like serine/threonine-protein kinase
VSTSAPGEELGADDLDVAARLCGFRHPHLVAVTSIERNIVITEQVDGVRLEDVFYRLSVGARLRAVVDVLTALSALHIMDGKSPIVHGGVLVRSALVDKTGRTKLGFAYRRGQRSDAPEMLLADAGAISVRTDVYNAGVLLWEAVTGRALFGGLSSEQIIKKQLGGRLERALPPASDRWARCVLPVIDRALSVDPKDRYPSIAEMAAALRIAVRARLMSHEDIIEEVWPAATVPRVLGGLVAEENKPAEPTSEMKVALSLDAPIPAATSPEEGAASGIVPTQPRRSRALGVAAAVAATVALAWVALSAATRHKPVAPPALATASIDRAAVSAQPAETSVAPPLPESVVPPPAASPEKETPRRAPLHRPAKPHVYDPSSI